MSMLRIKKLAGFEVPSLYEYAKRGDAKKLAEVELTEAQWNKIDSDEKGIIGGQKYFLTLESGALAMVPVKTSFVGTVSAEEPKKEEGKEEDKKDDKKEEKVDDKDAAKEEKTNEKPEDKKDDEKQEEKKEAADKKTEEKGEEKKDEAVEKGEKKEENKTEVKESAEEKAKKLIAAVKAGKRITDTSETQVDSNISVSDPKDELGTASVKDCDMQDEKVTSGKVEESASEIAKRIIASVNAGNHPHNADNSGDAATEKPSSFDYNKEIVNGTMVDNARENNPKELEVVADKDGEKQMETETVDVPAKVMSQLDQRISELKAAKAEFDNKGYNDTSVKQNAIDFLEKVKSHLGSRDVEGLNQAQILFATLMSPVTDLLPAALVNFLATAKNSEKTTGTKPETE